MPGETYKIAAKTYSMILWATQPDEEHKRRSEWKGDMTWKRPFCEECHIMLEDLFPTREDWGTQPLTSNSGGGDSNQTLKRDYSVTCEGRGIVNQGACGEKRWRSVWKWAGVLYVERKLEDVRPVDLVLWWQSQDSCLITEVVCVPRVCWNKECMSVSYVL